MDKSYTNYIFPDINECSSSPCQHNAICVDDANGYNCSCPDGYMGVHCETGRSIDMYII